MIFISINFMDGRSQLARSSDTISLLELKRLLHDLKDTNADVDIRFRFLGQMWQSSFLKVFVVTDTGAVLFNRINSQVEIITNFADVIQFELDSRFQVYQPNNHYSVLIDDGF